jgi:hypothetical protein
MPLALALLFAAPGVSTPSAHAAKKAKTSKKLKKGRKYLQQGTRIGADGKVHGYTISSKGKSQPEAVLSFRRKGKKKDKVASNPQHTPTSQSSIPGWRTLPGNKKQRLQNDIRAEARTRLGLDRLPKGSLVVFNEKGSRYRVLVPVGGEEGSLEMRAVAKGKVGTLTTQFTRKNGTIGQSQKEIPKTSKLTKYGKNYIAK